MEQENQLCRRTDGLSIRADKHAGMGDGALEHAVSQYFLNPPLMPPSLKSTTPGLERGMAVMFSNLFFWELRKCSTLGGGQYIENQKNHCEPA